VISRPEPPRAAAPKPPAAVAPEPVPAKPAAPERGSLPPFARRETRAEAQTPPPAPVAKVATPLEEAVDPVEDVVDPVEKAAAPVQKVARAEVPGVVVSSTVWHPSGMPRGRVGGTRASCTRRRDGSLVVSEIRPSGVVFCEGVEVMASRREELGWAPAAHEHPASRRPRIGTSERLSKSAAADRARSQVAWSITIDASRSRVKPWSRAARFVVLPIALQIMRSTAWMLPTNALPVAMPTPTESVSFPSMGSAPTASTISRPASTAARSL
jgi:hypothetical protein